MATISNSDVVSTVSSFVTDNNRPCPAKFLAEKFGADVLDVIDELKASGVLLGLRGRNGGLALPDSAVVAKRAEHAAKKASKVPSEATGEPVSEPAGESAVPVASVG
jgi:hypothetical protein